MLQFCPGPAPLLFHSTLRFRMTAGRFANAQKIARAAGGLPKAPVLIKIFPRGKRIAEGKELPAKKKQLPLPDDREGQLRIKREVRLTRVADQG